MKIKQAFLSESMKFFRPVFDGRFGLTVVNESGYDPYAPVVFHGIYRTEDVKRLLGHRGVAMVVWGGADAQKFDVLRTLALKEDIRHISISWYIDHTLRAIGLKPKFVPLPMTIPDKWEPSTLGNKVYCYAPNEVYGRSLAQHVAKNIPYETILTDGCGHKTQDELKEIYKQCFIGLRLREFDGIAASVQEMGLSGRRTVWNGRTPSSISWNSVDDIISAVHKEAERIGTDQPDVARQVDQWICKDDSWLEV